MNRGIGIVAGDLWNYFPLRHDWRTRNGYNIDVPEAVDIELVLRAVFATRPDARGATIRAATDKTTRLNDV